MISEEQLNKWKDEAEAATTGPWRICEEEPHIVIDTRFGSDDPEGAIIAECGGKPFADPFPENATFIASARTAVPILVDEIFRAYQKIEELQRYIRQLTS